MRPGVLYQLRIAVLREKTGPPHPSYSKTPGGFIKHTQEKSAESFLSCTTNTKPPWVCSCLEGKRVMSFSMELFPTSPCWPCTVSPGASFQPVKTTAEMGRGAGCWVRWGTPACPGAETPSAKHSLLRERQLISKERRQEQSFRRPKLLLYLPFHLFFLFFPPYFLGGEGGAPLGILSPVFLSLFLWLMPLGYAVAFLEVVMISFPALKRKCWAIF